MLYPVLGISFILGRYRGSNSSPQGFGGNAIADWPAIGPMTVQAATSNMVAAKILVMVRMVGSCVVRNIRVDDAMGVAALL